MSFVPQQLGRCATRSRVCLRVPTASIYRTAVVFTDIISNSKSNRHMATATDMKAEETVKADQMGHPGNFNLYSKEAKAKFDIFAADTYSTPSVRKAKFKSVITAVSQKDDLYLIRACMSKQIIANIPTTPTLSNKILDACLRVDKVANGEGLDKAFKWFTHTPKTNHMSTMQYDKRHVRMEVQPYTVTKLMRALTASERYADAAVVFKHWNKKMDLELSAYHVLFDIAAKDSTHLSAGVKHMEKMRQIGPIPNEKCYTDLAAAALHHGKKEIAARVMSYYELDAMKESVLSRRLRAESAEK